jgi:hypothetical protein
MPERFLRVEISITYVFSMDLHRPIPTAPSFRWAEFHDFSCNFRAFRKKKSGFGFFVCETKQTS